MNERIGKLPRLLLQFGRHRRSQRTIRRLLQYVHDTQRAALPHIRGLSTERRDEAVILDAATRRNLEITESLSGQPEHTLAGILDHTATPMGSRLLRRWLARPLRDQATVRARHAAMATAFITPLASSSQAPTVARSADRASS